MKIIELESTTTKIKTHGIGLVVEWRWQKMESLDLRTIKFTQSQQLKETEGGEGTCGAVTKSLGFLTSVDRNKSSNKKGVCGGWLVGVFAPPFFFT